MNPPTILLLAGEPSGDMWGAELSRELKKKWPQSSLLGIGGPLMKDQGVELIEGIDKLSIMGLSRVVGRLPYLLRLKRKIKILLDNRGIDLVIPIDFPGFNMSIIGLAHRRNVKVLYYVAPKVWAWGSSRIAKLMRCTDSLAVIFPFEEEFFRTRGCNARFVGHPSIGLDTAVVGGQKEIL